MSLDEPGKALTVRESNVRGASRGLFAGRDFAQGDRLPCAYQGDNINREQLSELQDCSYILKFERDWYIDAGPYRDCLARYINHASSDSGQVNVQFVRRNATATFADVVALRLIKSGEELYADYGEDYWEPKNAQETFRLAALIIFAALVGMLASGSAIFLLLVSTHFHLFDWQVKVCASCVGSASKEWLVYHKRVNWCLLFSASLHSAQWIPDWMPNKQNPQCFQGDADCLTAALTMFHAHRWQQLKTAAQAEGELPLLVTKHSISA